MTDFRPEPGASVFCRTDFTFQAVANIDFHDAAWREVPFHLSLRPREGRVVVNRRDAAGWRREIVLDHPLDPAGGTVELRFHTGAVTIWLDGRRLARFDRFPRPDRYGRLFLRRGFPDLADIAHVTVEGAVLPETLRLRSPRDRMAAAPVRVQVGGLALTERLEVEASAAGAVALRLSGGDAADVLALAPVPGSPGRLGAVLPGRIWAGVAPDAAANLQPLDAAGAPNGPALVVTRADLAAALVRLASGDRLDHDDLAALQAVEHARHSGVMPALPVPVQAALWQAAARFGLGGFLAQGMPSGAAPAPPRSTPDPRETARQAEDAVCRAVALALRSAPDANPYAVLTRALADHPAPVAMDKLLLRLAEPFCARDAFGPLWAQAKAAGLDFADRPWADDRWTNSVLMPFLLMAGRAAELPKLLWWLAEPRPGWLVTPTIAWAVQAALADPATPEALAEELIYAWIGFMDAQTQGYAGRSGCAALRAVSVRLVAEGARRAHWLRAPLRDFALRVHGLDPAFWAALATAGMPDDPLLAEAQAAFAALQTAVTCPDPQGPEAQAAITAALDLFGLYRNTDATRFRRILLGPAGVPLAPGQAPDLAALRRAGGDAGAALLRHLLFPDDRLAAPDDPALLPLAAAAVAPAWEGVPIPPMDSLQRDLAQRLPVLLAAAQAGQAPDAGTLDRLVADLAPLASARSRWLGLGLGLTLVEALADGPAACAAAADRLAQALVRLAAATPEAERPARDAAPAVAAVRARAAARPTPLALARALAPFTAPRRSPDLPAVAPWPGASPLHDLLVVVFSCRAYLDTRIPALRAGWLGDLAAMGIPYVVAVGGASAAEANTRHGDVVFLDAPDDYEGLPAKMLAMIAYVHDHTPFARLMKIDDDCFVDVPTLFGSLQPLKYDYLGRPLTRVRGQMDRAWHNAKATSARGRLELDKSPEPSSYADGGSGYILSRRAMAAARAAAANPEGQRLIGLSFMEDKLLGDLLAMEGIRVAGEGWRVAVERRTGASGLTVPQWENGPRPFAGSGIAVAHLDTHLTQAHAQAGAASPLPRRGKIWPSFQALRFGAGSNTLDLISPQARVQAVAAAPVAVVAVMRNEMFMLPAFLDHYRRLGTGGFLIADNGSDDGTMEYLLDQPDVAVFSVDTPYSKSMYGVAWQEALLAAFRPGRWTLVADADELLVWDDSATGSLPALLDSTDFAQADAVRTYMLDMYPEGPLSAATFRGNPFLEAPCTESEPFLASSFAAGPFSDAVTWTSGLRHRLIPGSRPELFVAQKVALLRYRPWMRLTEGLHYVGGVQVSPREMLLAHFKYNAAFRAKAEAEVARRQHFNDAEEYRKYLALVSEGRETIHDPALSVRWTASAFVRHLFAMGRAKRS